MGELPFKIGYLTTEYPKVSHSFIRREIVELSRRGHDVERFAIRAGTVTDEQDREEAERTYVCLSQPKWALAAATLWAQATRPLRWLQAVEMARKMSSASERGLLKHGAYVVEAALLTRICEQRNVKHVHVHFGTNATAVARLMRALGGPTYSFTVHGPDEFDAVRGFSLAEKAEDAAFVVAISEYGAAQLRRWVPPRDWQKIHVVHCTVGPDWFAHATPVRRESRTLLSVGRLSAQKGQLILVEAMRRVVQTHPDARLVLGGDGEMRAEVEQAIQQAGLQSQVEITGWIDEHTVRKLLSQARALVQPSFAEGLPVVIMEAFAMCRPVLSTQIAGIPELVRPSENGWLVTAGSVEELVEAMKRVLDDEPEHLDALGQAGQARVRREHATSTEVDKLEALFRALVS